jgi:hypothetical protein
MRREPLAFVAVRLGLLMLGACAEHQRAGAPPPVVPQVAELRPVQTISAAAVTPRARSSAPQRIRTTLSEPLGLSRPAATAAPPGESAPIPNRDIEAPRDRFANNLDPKFEPMLLPPERRQGVTFGREHLRESGPDNPFDTLVPGARLRIPFE